MQGSFLEAQALRARRQVKICGFTRPGNVRELGALEADAFGFVLFAKSRRAVREEELPGLLAAVPRRITPVLLLVDPELEEVKRLGKLFPEVMLQFHGSEPPELCEAAGLPYLKAVLWKVPGDLLEAQRRYPGAAGILVDCPAAKGAVPGGNGMAFDWKAAAEEARAMVKPLVLAGGLNAGNVARAIEELSPAALDVSSGVEAAAGVKDFSQAKDFLERARR